MNLLRKYIEINGITQRDAAKQLDVETATLWNWIVGKRKPVGRNRERIEAWTKGKVPVSYWDQLELKKEHDL